MISPDDVESSAKIVDLLIQAAKWIGGTVAAAWIAVRWMLSKGVRVGEEKQRYEALLLAVQKIIELDLDALAETVADLKKSSPEWITKAQYSEIRHHCNLETELLINNKMHKVIMEYRDEMYALNANICHIMGALNLKPVDQGKRRRRSDTEPEV